MTVITPTVGRIVWYRPGMVDMHLKSSTENPIAAIITDVFSDRCVSLTVFASKGQTFLRSSVRLIQDGDDDWAPPYAEWMPYQKGQAAKAAQAEAQAFCVGEDTTADDAQPRHASNNGITLSAATIAVFFLGAENQVTICND